MALKSQSDLDKDMCQFRKAAMGSLGAVRRVVQLFVCSLCWTLALCTKTEVSEVSCGDRQVLLYKCKEFRMPAYEQGGGHPAIDVRNDEAVASRRRESTLR